MVSLSAHSIWCPYLTVKLACYVCFQVDCPRAVLLYSRCFTWLISKRCNFIFLLRSKNIIISTEPKPPVTRPPQSPLSNTLYQIHILQITLQRIILSYKSCTNGFLVRFIQGSYWQRLSRPTCLDVDCKANVLPPSCDVGWWLEEKYAVF